MYIPYNFTLKEKLQLLPLDVRDIIENNIDLLYTEIEKLNKKVNIYDRNVEIIHEQNYFAKELIEGIIEILDKETKAKDIKKAINSLIEDSYFER